MSNIDMDRKKSRGKIGRIVEETRTDESAERLADSPVASGVLCCSSRLCVLA
jgi:hypothetical protein